MADLAQQLYSDLLLQIEADMFTIYGKSTPTKESADAMGRVTRNLQILESEFTVKKVVYKP